MSQGFDFDFTIDQLKKIVTNNPYIDHWYEALCKILPDYDINTQLRVAAFLAQCAHESGNFRAIKENLNYRAETLRKIFPKYFPTDDLAKQYAGMPNPQKQEAIANRVYANRMGNGPEESGDGFR
jgi:putative chitinase